MSSRVLILFAHPAFEKSRVNRRLTETVQPLAGVSFHNLYRSYPDLDIDAAREQELPTGHDVVVMQHPLYWHSTPSMLKEWEDLVLEHGWASDADTRRPEFLFSASPPRRRRHPDLKNALRHLLGRRGAAPVVVEPGRRAAP